MDFSAAFKGTPQSWFHVLEQWSRGPGRLLLPLASHFVMVSGSPLGKWDWKNTSISKGQALWANDKNKLTVFLSYLDVAEQCLVYMCCACVHAWGGEGGVCVCIQQASMISEQANLKQQISTLTTQVSVMGSVFFSLSLFSFTRLV